MSLTRLNKAGNAEKAPLYMNGLLNVDPTRKFVVIENLEAEKRKERLSLMTKVDLANVSCLGASDY